MNVLRPVDSSTIDAKAPEKAGEPRRLETPLPTEQSGVWEMGEVVFMTDQARRNFVRNLRNARERKFTHASEFARVLGIGEQRYRTWENPNSDAEPSIHFLILICRNLGVSPTYLLMNLTEEWGEEPTLLAKKQKKPRRRRN